MTCQAALGSVFAADISSKLENCRITPYDLLVTFQEEINHSFSCTNCWSSWNLVSIPLLCQVPVLLVFITGGAKHQGSGDVGGEAVRGQVLAGSAFLCPAWPAEVVDCFVFCPSFPALGAFWIMAKMVRTTCAFCSEGEAGSVMYIATERNIAAHQDCLVSAFSWSVPKRSGEGIRGSFHCLSVFGVAMMSGLKGWLLKSASL